MDVKTIREIIAPNVDTPASRAFDVVIQCLILISVVGFSVETLPGLSAEVVKVLEIVEAVIVVLFTCEYLVRIWVAENRVRFVFSFFGIVDLLAILPFYAGLWSDMNALRLMRILRLFRVFKLFRYSSAVRHFAAALREVKDELILYLIATALLMYLAATGIYYFEREANPEHFQSIFHSLWWSVVTLTTVGYGDAYPVTLGGRIFTGMLLIIGLGVISVPSGLIASGLTRTKKQDDAETPADPAEIESHDKKKPETPDRRKR